MYITDDGIRLNAEIDMPQGNAEKCPLVIIIHGFTGHMEERHILAVSKALNQVGCATLRVDMYGHGHSEGNFRDHTLFKWMTNAMTVIDYARTLDFVTDIYLCGHSQGGLTVMLAAALKHDVIKGIIPMSPGITIPEGARKGNFLGTVFDPDNIPDEFPIPGKNLVLGGNHMRVSQMINVDDYIDRYTGPVLLIHGDSDTTIPASCSIEASKRYRNAQLVLIPGDTHCYDHHLELVTDAVKSWMKRQLLM